MAKTLGRDIDLTSSRYFVHSTSGDTFGDGNNPFGLISSKMHKFPWNKSFRLSDGTFTNTMQAVSSKTESFGDSHWDYLGFAYYGGIDEPFFVGNKPERDTARHCLEEETFYDTEVGSICGRCGKYLSIFDKGSKQQSLLNYLPVMCSKCLEHTLEQQTENSIFTKYEDKVLHEFTSATSFTLNLERRTSWLW